MGRALGIEKKTQPTLKQHQGAKEGPQRHSSRVVTHLKTLSLQLATSTWGAEVAAWFAHWLCLLAVCNGSVISEQISFSACKSEALTGMAHPTLRLVSKRKQYQLMGSYM